jgi:CubicO group peptidase (beta-lactamase class C family)
MPLKKNMKNTYFILALLIIVSCNNVEEESIPLSKGIIEHEYHRNNIGQIYFMDKLIPAAEIDPIHNLTDIILLEGNELFVRILPEFSQTHYLSLLSQDTLANELCEKGNWNVKFYVNGKFIYEDNISPGAGFCGQRNEYSGVTIPLIAKEEVYDKHWGSYLWKRFYHKEKNEKLFLKGTNELTLEFRPYIKNSGQIKYGEVVAKGSVKISLKERDVDESLIKYQKIKEKDEWRIADQNFNKNPIRQINKKIAQNRYKDISSILVAYDGEILIEEYFNGSNRNTLHDTRSVGKSFVGTLMGQAISKGYIKDEDVTLNEFYNLEEYKNYSPKKDKISIKDLLTMSSLFEGNDMLISSPGNEENMYPTNNWPKFTLDLPIDNTKLDSAKWEYFTSGSVLLGDILNKVVPNTLENFAAENLFTPLSITDFKWQYTPSGVVNTAGSLQLSTLDLAKYGILYQQNGRWNNKQIISKNWVSKSKTTQIYRDIKGTKKGYGYQLWTDIIENNGIDYAVSYATGNGGSKVMIFEDIPLVVVITATAYGNPIGDSQADEIIQDYLLPLALEIHNENEKRHTTKDKK